ncbi:DUF6869 domain-containing protein [Kordiimonas aestuarii]|uniref:DUF6869 domain-containing protein n=1 Tax=Kordiimonas aestuarii TaxID=1005925 RepID=UPI0021D34872|nr:hypothetical protein [Kordiimonas aestuarii]
MTEHEIQQLAKNYLAYFLNDGAIDATEFRAVETMWRLCREDAKIAFRMIWVIVNMIEADNNKALSFLGTGPLEDLLNFHGDEVLGLLIEAARENSNFCVALSCVWKNALHEHTWSQLAEVLPGIRAHHGAILAHAEKSRPMSTAGAD